MRQIDQEHRDLMNDRVSSSLGFLFTSYIPDVEQTKLAMMQGGEGGEWGGKPPKSLPSLDKVPAKGQPTETENL